ncbi:MULTISPECIES: lanthionine synthetase C family protein [Streptomyces]|uniref:lanthionine synthetase C family protein n=1 Tax=Streptomyces TaxID=1883 RepID=UPI001AE8C69B|nr:lanthionine synthetase C family protein [Streptomyces sp. KCTC 0041BP]MBP0934760.1 lanthionine synthetase C family protein [Streptomyces sp. KCTC 0041BP]
MSAREHEALRARAAAAVTVVARRLADPAAADHPTPEVSPFRAASLSDGAPGIALLHTELGAAAGGDPAHRDAALRWVRRAAALTALAGKTPAPGPQGLYGPLAALSFALHRTADGPAAHSAARSHLREQVAELASTRAAREERRLTEHPDPSPGSGSGFTTFTAYDVISGQSGLGAHLLELGRPAEAALVRVLRALVGLSRPVRTHDRGLPGWWVALDGASYQPVAPARGHANLGMAHGMPGPLALLAIAWQEGVRVPGQRAAVTDLAQWLLARRCADAAGPWWPGQLSLGPAQPEPGRPSWCYGTPGVARALQLAGLALEVPQWQEAGVEALRAALARADLDGPARAGGTAEAGLCHGLAGLLQITWRTARDSGDPELAERVPQLAARLLELLDEEAPFGFAAAPGERPPEEHPGGFLTGAAGAALALDTFARDAEPATRWDRALLLA